MTKRQAALLFWKFNLFLMNAANVLLTENCNFAFENLVTSDTFFNGNQFWKAKTTDVFDCARVCIRRRSCKSFNFNKRTGMCGLNNDTSESDNSLTKDDEYLYSNIGVWPSQVFLTLYQTIFFYRRI